MYINRTSDIIDIREVIERFEELEADRDGFVIGAPDGTETPAPDQWAEENPSESEELEKLESLLDELKGYGGDEQWRGSWYPITLILDSHFTEYAEQLADDCGMVNSESAWPNNHIDWEAAAEELKADYSTVEYDGDTYWYR